MSDIDLLYQLRAEASSKWEPLINRMIQQHQRAAALEADDTLAEETCPGCGAAVVQTGKGRPRRWCSDKCRWRARNARKGSMAP